ncbi:hypothetical protein H6789_00085 [Candidatus Nomurabacteria bacterium]|nr:hypothetical protein [Candidatus Nomurabacteria bacterium]
MTMFIQIFVAIWTMCSIIVAVTLVTMIVSDNSAEKKALFSTSKQSLFSALGFILTVALGPVFMGFAHGRFIVLVNGEK